MAALRLEAEGRARIQAEEQALRLSAKLESEQRIAREAEARRKADEGAREAKKKAKRDTFQGESHPDPSFRFQTHTTSKVKYKRG